jgi:hypothetical protein
MVAVMGESGRSGKSGRSGANGGICCQAGPTRPARQTN